MLWYLDETSYYNKILIHKAKQAWMSKSIGLKILNEQSYLRSIFSNVPLSTVKSKFLP